jgi:hypothetical protein
MKGSRSNQPGFVPGVEAEEVVEEDVAQGRAPHGEARVAGVGLLHGVHGQEPDGVYQPLHRAAGRARSWTGHGG